MTTSPRPIVSTESRPLVVESISTLLRERDASGT
jgi:hypothetical protein